MPPAVRTIDALGDAIDPPARAREGPPAHPPTLLGARSPARAQGLARGSALHDPSAWLVIDFGDRSVRQGIHRVVNGLEG
jgi:hypothetical protein